MRHRRDLADPPEVRRWEGEVPGGERGDKELTILKSSSMRGEDPPRERPGCGPDSHLMLQVRSEKGGRKGRTDI